MGILAGGILLIVALTGALLVYEQELDVWLYPEYFAYDDTRSNPVLPIHKVQYICEVRYGGDLEGLFWDEKREGYTIRLHSAGDLQVWLDPYTAEELGRREYVYTVMGFIRHLHRTLVIPVVGRYIVGIASLLCLVLMITGLRQWVPKKLRLLKDRVSVRWSAGPKRVNYDLHNTLGFFFSPFIALIAVTGTAITFLKYFAFALFLVSFQIPQSLDKILSPKSAYVADVDPIGGGRAIEIVTAYSPEGDVAGISLPRDSTAVYAISVITPDPKNAAGKRSTVNVDQYSGDIVFDTAKDLPPTADVFYNWLTPIHFGTFGGHVTRILALITSLVLAYLFYTGIKIWLPRYRKSIQRKAL